MQWIFRDGYCYLIPRRSDPPRQTDCQEQLCLGLERHTTPTGETVWAIANPDRVAMSAPFISQTTIQAHNVVAEFIQIIRTLHCAGARLGEVTQFEKQKRKATIRFASPEKVVSILRTRNELPVLYGTGENWIFEAPRLTYSETILKRIPALYKVANYWRSLVRTAWKKCLIQSILYAKAIGDRTALIDWHTALQVIFLQLSMCKKHGAFDLAIVSKQKQRLLKPGLLRGLGTRLIPRSDYFSLHLGLGVPPQGGFRYWMRYLERSILNLTFADDITSRNGVAGIR